MMPALFGACFGLSAQTLPMVRQTVMQKRLFQAAITCASESSAMLTGSTALTKENYWDRANPRQYRGVDNWNRIQVTAAASPVPANIARSAMTPFTTVTDVIELPKFAFFETVRWATGRTRGLLRTVLVNATVPTAGVTGKEVPLPPKQRSSGDCTFCKGPSPIGGLQQKGSVSAANSAKKCATGKDNCFTCCGRNRG